MSCNMIMTAQGDTPGPKNALIVSLDIEIGKRGVSNCTEGQDGNIVRFSYPEIEVFENSGNSAVETITEGIEIFFPSARSSHFEGSLVNFL